MIFRDITSVEGKLQQAVREWRNHVDIRSNMYTDDIISDEQHQDWLSLLETNKTTRVYVAYKNSDTVGVVSISRMSELHKTADWAFYLAPCFLSAKGLGTLMEYHFLNYVFETFAIEKLNCEVLETNDSVIRLHKKFGFTVEGVRRKNVLKKEKRIDVYLLGMLKEEWLQTRGKFTKVVERLER